MLVTTGLSGVMKLKLSKWSDAGYAHLLFQSLALRPIDVVSMLIHRGVAISANCVLMNFLLPHRHSETRADGCWPLLSHRDPTTVGLPECDQPEEFDSERDLERDLDLDPESLEEESDLMAKYMCVCISASIERKI
eukprot:148103-Amorphochlora_amoeboformis.AAC.1